MGVQGTFGWHKAVGGDMKVEQTIQRDSKGPGGHHVVGETRKAKSCANYELLYHVPRNCQHWCSFERNNMDY